jgi:UDPglucose 6-dehydrogenase
MADSSAYDFKILDAVMEVNRLQKQILAAKLNRFFEGDLKGKTIAVWGLAFKPSTDDIREAPAIDVIRELLAAGAVVQAYDPEAMGNMKRVFGDDVLFADNMYDALDGADALAIITAWNVFRMPDYDEMGKRMKARVIFDGRNVYDKDEMHQLGFTYESIGRP